MKKTISHTLVTTLILLTTPLYALNTDIPKQCPNVSALKAIGYNFDSALGDKDRGWYVAKEDSYGTDRVWTLIAAGFRGATTKAEAIARAKDALPTLQFIHGPIEAQPNWYCYYRMDNVDFVVAVDQSIN